MRSKKNHFTSLLPFIALARIRQVSVQHAKYESGNERTEEEDQYYKKKLLAFQLGSVIFV